MKTALASASALTIALMLGVPAAAQDQTAPVLPGVGADTTTGAAGTLGADTGVAGDTLGTDPAMTGTDGIAADTLGTDPAMTGTDGMAADTLGTDTGVAGGAGMAAAGERMDAEALRGQLSEIGIDDAAEFQGAIIHAQAEEGFPVVVLVGPEGFEIAEGDAPEIGADALREGFTEAGFQNVQEENWELMQGTLDGHSVFAIAADAGMATPPAAGEEFDGMRDKLAEAGIDNVEQVEAKLFRASTEEGQSLFLLVGPEGFAADGSIELSDEELTERLEEAGLDQVQLVDDGVEIARGEHEDGYAVLAVAGSGFAVGNGAMAN